MSKATVTIELNLLGAPQVLLDGTLQHMPYQKATALLAYLAVTARAHSRDALATLLWGQVDDQRARNSLRNALYVIRRHLKPAVPLITEDQQVSLNVAQIRLDVTRFKRAIRREEAGADPLTRALDLWRGPFLDGLMIRDAPDFDRWMSNTRDQLNRYYQEGHLALSRAHASQTQWHQALEAALRVVTLDPLYEAGHRQVMRLHLQMGHRSAALQQYEQCRDLLLEELGVMPEARTQALREQALSERPIADLKTDRPVQSERKNLFVGRQREMVTLTSHLRKVVGQSRGRLVLVEGEAGVGKTRLVREWLKTLQHVHTLTSRCFEAEQGVPYHPWIDLLRHAQERPAWDRIDLTDLWMSELTHLLPELRTHRPDLPRPAAPNPELARGRLSEAVHQWLKALAQQLPVCLFIDDLQWIDRASLAMLEYVLRHSQNLPLMMVGTQRERETDPAWQRTQNLLDRESLCHRITLFRLSFTEVAAIARDLGFQAADPAAFLKRLFRETEGNPLFVVESLQTLHRMDIDPSGEWPIPPTVKGVIQARLNRLSTQTRQLLTVAAVIGRTFEHTTLHAVTEQPAGRVLHALDGGIAAGLVVEGDGRYDFSHDQIRAVLYRQLSRARRQHLHRRIAETLQTQYKDDLSSHLGMLAHHFEAAGETEPARNYALQAARRAVELYADEDALQWYDRALALSEIAPDELSAELRPKTTPFQQDLISTSLPLDAPGLVYRQQGLIHQRRGRYNMAQERFQQALIRAQERERLDEQAAAHSLLSYLAYLQGDYGALTDHARRSLELSRGAGEAALQAEGLRNLGIAAYRQGDYRQAIRFYHESLAASRAINDQAGMAKCHNNIGFALRTLQRFDEAVNSFRQALNLHETTGSIEGAAGVLANIGSVYVRSGNMAQALEHLNRAIAMSEKVHADWITAKAWRTLGNVYLQNAQWTEALDAARQARALAEKLGNKEDLGATYRLLGEIAAAWPESDMGAAEPYFEKSLSLLQQVGEQYELTRAQSSLKAYRRAQNQEP